MRISFEYKTRYIDFDTKDEAEKYLSKMAEKYNVSTSESEIYKQGDFYTLKVIYTNRNAKISGGW